jgi:hypothetical protein
MPWQGMIQWEYEMKFDSQFMTTLGGGVMSIQLGDGGGNDVRTERSVFGQGLVYCNAGLHEEF